jgi:hypothetical protein
MDQNALKREFDADRGQCFYCGGKQYVLIRMWYKHITEQHSETYRAESLRKAVGT